MFSKINLTKLVTSSLILISTIGISLNSVPVLAASTCISRNQPNIAKSGYANLTVSFSDVLKMPIYNPGFPELNDAQKVITPTSSKNATFVFQDKNDDYILRAAYVAQDYKLGDRIDDIKGLKTTRNNTYIKRYICQNSLSQIASAYIYNIPKAKQAEFKVDTFIRFKTYDGKIYGLAFYKNKKNPGIKVWLNSVENVSENVKRNIKNGDTKVEFYK